MVTLQAVKARAQEIGGLIVASEAPGGSVKELRQSIGLTQEEVGEVLGLRRETVSRIENGNINPSFGFLQRFSKAVAFLKAIREHYARRDASMEEKISLPSPNVMRMYLHLSGKEINTLYRLGEKSYVRSKKRALKVIK